MGKHLIISMALFDFAIAASFGIEGKYAWMIIFLCATVSNIASLWLFAE